MNEQTVIITIQKRGREGEKREWERKEREREKKERTSAFFLKDLNLNFILRYFSFILISNSKIDRKE